MRLTDICLGALFLWSSIPETLTGDIYLLDVPLLFVLFYGAVFCATISVLVRKSCRVDGCFIFAIAACASMALLGLFQGNSMKFWALDITNFSGLMFGIYWGINRSSQHIRTTVCWWASSITLVLLLNLLGLVLGFVPQANEGVRLYSYSLFVSSAFITAIFPFWMLLPSKGNCNSIVLRYSRQIAIFGMCCVVVAAILSASRGLFLACAASTLLVLWLQFKGKHAALWLILTSLGCFLIFTFGFNNESWRNANLTGRFFSTDFAEESRYLELELMFEDLEGHMLTGNGFGSQFVSSIGQEGEFLAYAPHIAILTLLYKGGVLTFLIGIVYPLVFAMSSILWRSHSKVHQACCAGIVIYGVQSSMSGGWNMIALFLLGAMISLTRRTMVAKQTVLNNKKMRQLAMT